MTRLTFDHANQARLLREYVETLPAPRISNEHDRLQRVCHTFHTLYPEQSCLDVTHSTQWLRSWARSEPNPSVLAAQVEALGRWWCWLFDREVLDDNVLACFYPYSRVLRETSSVVLSHNLQRLIARYLNDHGPRSCETQRKLRRRLESFNLFVHRQVPAWDGHVIDEQTLLEWFRRTCGGGNRYMGLVAGTISGFLDYLVEAGRVPANPVIALKARYGHRRIGDILARELDRESCNLTPVAPKPQFRSRLAPHLDAFVSLKRAMGNRYEATLCDLQRFDRFVAELPDEPDVVTAELVQAWMAHARHLSPRTQKQRLGLVRQFSIYLARIHPETYVPDRSRFPVNVPPFRAHIYSSEEYRALLQAALELPSPRSTLRPKTFHTALLLLYATGLRIREGLRLRLRDVDLDAHTLLIRETKFFKTRIVPFSPTLAQALRAYLQERRVAATGPDAPLFINYARRPYSVDKFSEVFRTLLDAAGVPHAPRTPRPRVADIRHTFAVTRVLQWYRDGADLQAKLPLLATYMGHVDVLSTQVYLNSTAELLREASDRFERAFGALVAPPQEVRHDVR